MLVIITKSLGLTLSEVLGAQMRIHEALWEGEKNTRFDLLCHRLAM